MHVVQERWGESEFSRLPVGLYHSLMNSGKLTSEQQSLQEASRIWLNEKTFASHKQ